MPFLDSLDIANRALQHVGGTQITDVNEDSKNNTEASFAYDKVRRAEMRRNVWRFAVRKAVLRPVDTTTMLLVPDAYSASKTYLPGAIVKDTNGLLWLSMEADNTNNTPGDTDVWEMYFGPLSVSLYDSAESYYAGDLVYKPGSVAGSYAVFMSLQNGNSDTPDVATAYDAAVTYTSDDVVSYGGYQWRSLIPVNLGITPAVGPSLFDSGATYSSAQTVTASDHFIYSSVGSGNIGHDPVTDGGVHWTNTGVANAWARTPTIQVSSIQWRVLDATIKKLSFVYPVGSGPSTQTSTRNVFRLPSGFLREAPQDPKAGSVSYLGAPSGGVYSDWNYEGDFIVSSCVSAIIIRFVADITKVAAMDDMFCEGLACRIATAICEPITQSGSKLQTIASAYKLFMGEARTVNAIETGSVEPPLDDYIACRG